MTRYIYIFLALVGLVSCNHRPEQIPIKPKLVVDVKESKLAVVCESTKTTCYETEIETSRKGIGHRINSGKTPIGNYTVTKEPYHRFGPVLRLSGYQGNRRGILIHKDFKNGNGTGGCICPLDLDRMEKVFNLVKDDTPLEIKY